MAEQELDRSAAATPYKLSEARKRGQVAKSADLVSALVFGMAIVFLQVHGWDKVREQFQLDRLLLAGLGQSDQHGWTLWVLTRHALTQSGLLAAPLFLSIMLTAVAANLLQTGPLLSPHPIKPDWSRLSPLTGFKRVFSTRTLFDTMRTLLKLSLLGYVVYGALTALMPQFHQIAGMPSQGFVRLLLDDLSAVGLKLALAMLVIAAIDHAYTLREFSRKMRMSQRELKDEHKHREGDPRIRARIRELRRELLKRSRMLSLTGKADVLITNPTHLAVALRYEHGAMAAPVMLGKGHGLVADAMRKIAALHRIPVVENRSLARALYAEVATDAPIPEQHYAAVARLMVWVLAMREASKRAPAPEGAIR
ncbi:EscU/YscU/HrcU family type III secretion system export apparatus switch protein [Roseateles toxinivorans]|uniref:Flagellar biosynthetic protein FlhB n=1 Tax=Roseateles toxinivorans TaxID=270368 RepID=A0A4R6QH53_9BURK|nr:EscU/YscU/HrcU family type III secretion system export apparatus switch protein [Roseateles toxinivorans]TDP61409.1 flagellar biosynthetic protein FlhB [Roseateles toxinivorans]